MDTIIYSWVSEDYIEVLKKKVQENEKKIEELLKIEKKTYSNFFNEMALLGEELSKVSFSVNNENSTHITDLGKEMYKRSIPIINEYESKKNQNEDIAKAIIDIYENEDLDRVKKRILEQEILEFKSNGIGIEAGKKKRIKEINLELSNLANEFSQNVTDATNIYEMIIEDEGKLKEMPQSDKDSAKIEEGKWKFTLHIPSYIAFMTYCDDRELRKEMYTAFVTRAPENEDIIEKTLKLRKEKSAILGYKNFRELSVASKTADSGEEVIEFLKEIAAAALPKAKGEAEELEEYGKTLGYDRIAYYDTAYISRRVKAKKYSFDPSETKPYFEIERTLKGMFDFLGDLFNMEFRKQEKAELWSEKASAYEVRKDGKDLGVLILDLETSKTKRGGAWAGSSKRSYLKADGTREYSIGQVTCNFPKSTEKTPSLLEQDNVVTLFHEMGHALHNLTSTVDEISASGFTGTEWDVVEYPSQWFQEFANNRDVLKKFARHYETGEVIPDELLDKLFESKKFGSGMAVNRQIEFGLFDMLIHDRTDKIKEVQEVLDSVRKLVNPIETPDYNRFQNQFSHIFSGMYSAGYYSYKWAEVLSADSYLEMVKGGKIDRKLANEFYEKLLSKGGSKNMKDSFVEVHGRKPDGKSLLKIQGIL